MWTWASVSPGRAQPPPRSSSSVAGPARAATSAREPAAATRPPASASASCGRQPSWPERTTPPARMRSAPLTRETVPRLDRARRVYVAQLGVGVRRAAPAGVHLEVEVGHAAAGVARAADRAEDLARRHAHPGGEGHRDRGQVGVVVGRAGAVAQPEAEAAEPGVLAAEA